jgi:uncharacterized protein YaaN involved in tellurite resistance
MSDSLMAKGNNPGLAKAKLAEISLDEKSYLLTNFSGEEQSKIKNLASQINVEDSQGVIVYGVGAQREISNFSDAILQEVKSKDSGFVGEILTDMVIKIKDLNIHKLGDSGNLLSSIPILGSLIDAVKRFMAKYEKLSVHIEKIMEELDKGRMNLLKDITMLDSMYEKNQEYLKNLDYYIAAGLLKLKELKETVLPQLKAQADKNNDPLDTQKLQDFSQCLNRFEKKIHDLKLSRMITIQTAPQIRLIQNNNQALVEKIQSSILNTIPLWKNQIVIAISLFRQKKSLKLQQEISKTTNELLTQNSELLKQSSLDIAKENEKGIVELETLKKVNQDLITTIEETLKIQQEGKTRRQQVETELVKMEDELKLQLKKVN